MLNLLIVGLFVISIGFFIANGMIVATTEFLLEKTNPIKKCISDRRAHAAYLKQLKEREQKLGNFTALQECPKCRKFGYFYMEKSNRRGVKVVTRICSECGHRWQQQ